jgi:NADH dehydrogenase
VTCIAITGGSGFLGVHVAADLLAAGHRVVLVDRGTRALPATLAGVPTLERRRADLCADIDPELFAGCEVLVNLVGIKRERGEQTFERVHVELVARLHAAAHAAGLAQLVHVSVAGARRARSPYLDSKARGEATLVASASAASPACTILRPGVIYGRGDDLLRNLADAIRAAPLFVAPRSSGVAPLIQPVAVEDVALAIRRCIEQPASTTRTLDVVGPEALTLAQLIDRVAEHVGRPCRTLALPAALMQPAAWLLERASADPLITRSQLGLLAAGVVGVREPLRRELGIEPRRLDARAIEAALVDHAPRLPSVRLVPDRAAMLALAQQGATIPSGRLLAFTVCAVAGLLAGPQLIPDVAGMGPWLRMPLLELVLASIALLGLPLAWRSTWRASLRGLGLGLGLALLLWLASLGVTAALAQLAPALWSGVDDLYGWAHALAPLVALPLLLVVVAGEEIVWRGALGLGLAAKALEHERVGLACVASGALFALAHLTTGNALLWLAALLAGCTWTAIAIRTRSLFVSFVCHLAWDVALLWLTPLA